MRYAARTGRFTSKPPSNAGYHAKVEKAYDEAVAAGSKTIGERTFLPITDEYVLYFPDGRSFTVADIKANRANFHGQECADPVEGLDYKSSNPGIIYCH